MTMNPAEISRKVQQLDNDVEAIYQMVSQVQGTLMRQANRLDEIDRKLESFDTRVTTRVDGLESKFDVMAVKVDGLDTKFDALAVEVDALGTKLDTVLERLS